jgi:stress response protein SCP2
VIELGIGQELALTGRLRMGVGWDKTRNAGPLSTGVRNVDLDASAVQFGGGRLFDIAFYNNATTRDGSVVHLGDNLTGRGEGDDEVITVDLARVYERVDRIALMISSYQGHTLEWVNSAYCRISDEHDGRDRELGRLTLTEGVPTTGLALALLVRDGAGWRLRAIGEGIDATVPSTSVEALRPFL